MSWCSKENSITCKIVTSNTPPNGNNNGGGIGSSFDKSQNVAMGKQLMLKTKSQSSSWKNLIGSGASSSDRLKYSRFRR